MQEGKRSVKQIYGLTYPWVKLDVCTYSVCATNLIEIEAFSAFGEGVKVIHFNSEQNLFGEKNEKNFAFAPPVKNS